MIPRTADDVTAQWLSEALQDRVPGVRVSSIVAETVRDATNANLVVRVEHDAGDRLPNRLFVKLPPFDPDRRARLDWGSMGRREVRFYRDLAAHIPMRVPEAFVVDLDETSGDFCLVLECVDRGSLRLPDVVAGLDPQMLFGALTSLAGLHARFETATTRVDHAGWLKPSGRSSDYGARLLRQGIDSDSGLAPAFVAVAERYIADRENLQDAWEEGPTTVLHGDGHIGNLFIDEATEPARVGFFDWGLMTVGSPMRDVSYLISMTLSPADRRQHEEALIAHYLDQRRGLNAKEIGIEDAWRLHRIQSAYCVVASCQSIAVPPDTSSGRRAFAAAFVGRATAAVQDLDPLAALDDQR